MKQRIKTRREMVKLVENTIRNLDPELDIDDGALMMYHVDDGLTVVKAGDDEEHTSYSVFIGWESGFDEEYEEDDDEEEEEDGA